jgi:hypothetical protein
MIYPEGCHENRCDRASCHFFLNFELWFQSESTETEEEEDDGADDENEDKEGENYIDNEHSLKEISKSGRSIDIGQQKAPFVFFLIWICKKSLLIMGPNSTKNSSLKWDFLIINHE